MNQQQEMIVQQAIAILDEQIREVEMVATAPHIVRQYLRLKLERLEHEVFGGLFLDSKHQLITDAFLFRGTLTSASVYPREVVKEALKTNADAVIFYHNHPSGVSEPSRADEQITTRLKDALALVDVRVLDHIVVGHGEMTSFAERGLI